MGKGYWDDSPRFYDRSMGALMSKSMFTAVHPTEDRYLNVREMMHIMGLPHDFEIDHVKNINHIAQNVPVNTAKDMADEVKLFCEGQHDSNYCSGNRAGRNHQKASCDQEGNCNWQKK